MTESEFKKLIPVIRPKMLEEIRKYRPDAHGRLNEADEEEIVADTIAALHRWGVGKIPDDEHNIWKRFMAEMRFFWIKALKRAWARQELSLESVTSPDRKPLGDLLPSTKYSPDRVLERDQTENDLLRLVGLLKTVPMNPRYRRVVDLAYLDSPETSLWARKGERKTSWELRPEAVAKVREMEGVSEAVAQKLCQRARAALVKALLSYLKETKDPLLHLVEDRGFLGGRTEEQ